QPGETGVTTDQKECEGRQQAQQRGANLCCPLKHINSRSVLHVRQKTVVIGLVIPSRPRSARGAGGLRRVVGAETLGADAGKNKVAVRRIVSAVTRGTGISDRRQALPVKRRTTAGAPGTVAFNQDVPPTDFALRSSQLHDRRGSSARSWNRLSVESNFISLNPPTASRSFLCRTAVLKASDTSRLTSDNVSAMRMTFAWRVSGMASEANACAMHSRSASK